MWNNVHFKRMKAGMDLEFSFFSAGCQTKGEEQSLFYYLPIVM